MDTPEAVTAAPATNPSDSRLRQLVEYAPLSIGMFDRELRCLALSRRAEQDFFSGTGPILGRKIYDVFPECPDRWRIAHRRALSGEILSGIEDFWDRADGQRLWMRYDVRPWLDDDGEIGGIVCFVEDITERRQFEEELRAREEQLLNRVEELEKLLNLIPIPIWIARDPSGTKIQQNQAAGELLRPAAPGGADSQAGVATTLDALRFRHRGRDLSPESLPLQRAIETRTRQCSSDLEVLTPDGRRLMLSGCAVPLFDGAQQVRGAVAVHWDITVQKQTEASLRESRERLVALLDAASDSILTLSEDGVIQGANLATEQMFGFGSAELLGRDMTWLLAVSSIREFFACDGGAPLRSGFRGLGRTLAVTGLRRDGSTFPAELTVHEIPHLRLFAGIVHDVSMRRNLERDAFEAVSSEQRRIGQDLHDFIGQELTGLSLMADTLRDHATSELLLIEKLSAGLRRCHHNLRNIMRGLLPVAVDQEGLMAALVELAVQTSQSGELVCTFECPAPVAIRDNRTATQLFLIAQEAVHNAVRHARPRNIKISLLSAEQLVLRIADDGCGMTPRPAGHLSLGLQIMRNRSEAVGATLSIQPARPTGTVVTCTLARFNEEQL